MYMAPKEEERSVEDGRRMLSQPIKGVVELARLFLPDSWSRAV